MSNKGIKINRRAIEQIQKEIGKEFERAARKHPVRVPVQTVMPDVFLGAEGPQRPLGTVEADPYQSLLLRWLSEQGHEHQIVNISAFIADHELSQDDARAVVVQLEHRDLIKVSTSLTGKDITQVQLTEAGVIEAQRLQRLRNSRTARLANACDELLRWAFEAGQEGDPVEIMAFVDTAGSYFAGDSLTVDEILGAFRYLEQRGLVQHAGTADTTTAASIKVRVTDDGTDCVLSGRTVNDFLSHQRQGGDTYHIKDSTGFMAGRQHKPLMNNTIGFDPSDMRQFADLVLQLVPTLGIAPEQQEELIHDAEILSEETTGSQPEPGRVRAAYQRVQEALTAVTTTSAGLTVLIKQGQDAYQAVFGG
ncbi:hypothetical protein BJY14_007710 [Actinomadura luteofluorescens]|uniref:Uncharacterized protein n=1 Tax=Actinomadura luteofluorescens TaxID=46163 RepID=A0A7Y9JJR2_9ACTN|nr:hypothetical protein [Actinomadura luteofluorescens]NYD51727.1 hypothetical protein [Actinomadura luteofluorescens]